MAANRWRCRVGTLINRAVEAADTPYVVLLPDNVTETQRLLDELGGHASRPEVGLVGGTLYDDVARSVMLEYPGLNGVAVVRTSARRRLRGVDGNAGFYVQQIGAVSSECAALRREVFVESGGMDEALSGDLRDVVSA